MASVRALISPTPAQLRNLSALCLRSKAYWGYDNDFLAACREELTLRSDDLIDHHLGVIGGPPEFDGMVLVGESDDGAELTKLYVDQPAIGRGLGRILFQWAVETALALGHRTMTIEADPAAAPFYERMGATQIGDVPSGSIPGRSLPLLRLDLRNAQADCQSPPITP